MGDDDSKTTGNPAEERHAVSSPDNIPPAGDEPGEPAEPVSENVSEDPPETTTGEPAEAAAPEAPEEVYHPRPRETTSGHRPPEASQGNALFALLLTAAAAIGGLGALWYFLPLGRGLITLWHQSLGGFSYGHQSGYPLAVWLMQAAGSLTDGTLHQQVAPFAALYGITVLMTAGIARRLHTGSSAVAAMATALGLVALSPLLMLTPFIDPRGALVAFTVIVHVCAAAVIGRRAPSVGGAIALGFTAGLMLLAGPEGMVVAPASLLWLVWQKWLSRSEGWLAVAVAVLVWSPQLVFDATHDISPLTALAHWWYEPRFAADALFDAALHTLAVANVAVVLLALGGLLIALGRGLISSASGWRMTGWASALLLAYTVVLWADPDIAVTPVALPAALLLLIAAVSARTAQYRDDRDDQPYRGHTRRWSLRIGVLLLALVAGYVAYIWQDSMFAANIGEPPARLRSLLQTPSSVLAAAGDDCAQAAYGLRAVVKPGEVRCIDPGAVPADTEDRALVFRCNAGILNALGCERPDVHDLAGWCLCKPAVAEEKPATPARPAPVEKPPQEPAAQPVAPPQPEQTPEQAPEPVAPRGPATIDI